MVLTLRTPALVSYHVVSLLLPVSLTVAPGFQDINYRSTEMLVFFSITLDELL